MLSAPLEADSSRGLIQSHYQVKPLKSWLESENYTAINQANLIIKILKEMNIVISEFKNDNLQHFYYEAHILNLSVKEGIKNVSNEIHKMSIISDLLDPHTKLEIYELEDHKIAISTLYQIFEKYKSDKNNSSLPPTKITINKLA
ncbi:16433_t:CDS:2 [Cetraspora pellucida]|uniref:16433_t:CDS:1 n=1 Tax=Cetraspora pellucida TaxID=1433469 RepID=A0A9N9HNZ4_9GLOM|nr:16433_t:CDS:2 [Cetraspora pellucida]